MGEEPEPEWKKQAPVLKVRIAAPKKAADGTAPEPVAAREPAPPEAAAAAPEPEAPPLSDPERVQRLADAAFAEFKAAEDRVAEALEVARPLVAGANEVTQEMAVEAAQATERAVESAIAAILSAAKAVGEKSQEMGKTEAALKMKSSAEFLGLSGKFKHCKSKMEELRAAVTVVRRRTTDEKKAKEQRETFDAYDVDRDGCLSRQEVMEFAKGEYSFEPSGEQVEKILRSLAGEEAGVPFEKLHRLRAMVAIDKSVVRARERETKKAEIQETATDVDKELKAADEAAAKAKASAAGLAAARLVELRLAVEKVEAESCMARALLEKAEDLAAKMAAPEDGLATQDEVLKCFREELAAEFASQVARSRKTLEAATGLVERARKRFKQAALAENEAFCLQVACAARGAMHAKGTAPEQLFEQAGGGAAGLAAEPFVAFVRSLADLCPLEALPETLRQDTIDLAKVEGLFSHLSGGAATLGKERFLKKLTRMCYRVAGETALAEDQAEGAPAKRQLAPGETVEALDLAEAKDPAGGARWLRCRASKDGLEGWAKVVDLGEGKGAAFLEPAGSVYTCVKETILTESLKIADGETLRRVAKGEILEALDFETLDEACGVVRIECKALRDGKTGWVSVAGNTGVAFLERLR